MAVKPPPMMSVLPSGDIPLAVVALGEKIDGRIDARPSAFSIRPVEPRWAPMAR